MKPFKVVWLRTDTMESHIDDIKSIKDEDFLNKIQDASSIHRVEGAIRIYRWDGKEYVPYNYRNHL